MIVTLPLPPSANDYWRVWRGRAVVSTEARAYKQSAALAARAQGLRPILAGEVAVVLRVFRPTRRGDLDNRLKVLLDALRGVAFRDDAQVSALLATQLLDVDNPRVEVQVEPLGEGETLTHAFFRESLLSPKPKAFRPPKEPLGPVIRSADWKPAPS